MLPTREEAKEIATELVYNKDYSDDVSNAIKIVEAYSSGSLIEVRTEGEIESGYIKIPSEKRCSKCKKILPIFMFNGLNAKCKECYRLYNRTIKRRKYNYQWRKEHNYDKKGFPRIRRNAKQRVIMAVKRGTIIKLPCGICGNSKVEGHHEDYNKPLEVVWLCNKHHRERHQLLRKPLYEEKSHALVGKV